MATTVKEILDTLTEDDRAFLNLAFEHELSQYIVLKDGTGKFTRRYIGVNCDRIMNLSAEMVAGVWSVGTIN